MRTFVPRPLAAVGRSFARSLVLAVAGCVVAGGAAVGAQDDAGRATEGEATAEVSYLRIAASGTALRCFPTEQSPLYQETLAEGDVVRATGVERNDFLEVELPLGVLGWVHSRFASVGADGVVRSSGRGVSFRYRPQSGEAATTQVEDGTEFRLVATEGDWLQVRYPGRSAWIGKASGVALDAPAGESAWNDLAARQAAVVEATARQRAAAVEAAAVLTAARDEFEVVRSATDTALAEAQTVADCERPIAALTTYRDGLEEDHPLRGEVDALLAQANRKREILELRAKITAEPQPIEPADLGTRAVGDPLSDYATGWLHVRSPLIGDTTVVLEKGEQVLFELTCDSGRYELDLFDGMEVAVRGAAERPDPGRQRALEVGRIEVIGRKLR